MISNSLPTFTSLINHPSNVVAQLTKMCRPVGCCPVRLSPTCLSPSWFVAQMTVHLPVNSLLPPSKLGLPVLCHFNVAMNVDYDRQMVRSHILTDWPLVPLSNVRMCHSNVRWTEAPTPLLTTWPVVDPLCNAFIGVDYDLTKCCPPITSNQMRRS